MVKIKIILLSLLCFLLFCSKQVTKTDIADQNATSETTQDDAPSIEKAPVKRFQPVASIINVPLEIKTQVAAQMINQQLKELLYECDTLTVGGVKPVKVRVWKKDSIQLSLHGDELSYKIPLRIWMQFSFTIDALGLKHTEYQDVEASIALKFKSRLFVKNNWKIVTMTQSEGYEWISDPVVKVRFLTIPVKPIADMIISKQTSSFGDMIDKAVSSMVDVKKMILPLWNKMQSPILLSSSPDSLWLRLSPQGIYMTQLEGVDNMIKSSIGIKSVAETFFGTQPPSQKVDSLPEFVIPGKVDSSFIINLYSELSYESATQMTRGFIVGRSFTYNKYEVIINDVNIYGLEGYALVSIDLSGSYKGKVYVIGQVRYDSAKQTISIEDLEFDLTTKNRLAKTADWLLHGIIVSKIKPFLSFPLKDKLLESQLMVQKMLGNKEIFKNVYINGYLDSLSIGGISCTDNAIQSTLLAKGALTLRVHD